MSERTPFVPSGQSVIIFSSGSILGQQQLLMLDVDDLTQWPPSFVDDPFGKLMSILRPIEYIFDGRTDRPVEVDVANIISGGITCSEQLRYFVRRAGFGQIQLGHTASTSSQPGPLPSKMVRFDFIHSFTPTLPEFVSPFTKFFRKKMRHLSKRSDDSILEMASNPSYLRSFLVVVNRLVPENYRAIGSNWSNRAFVRSCSFHGFRPSTLRERNLQLKLQVGSELA